MFQRRVGYAGLGSDYLTLSTPGVDPPTKEEVVEQAAQATSFVTHPTWHDLCVYMDGLCEVAENELASAQTKEQVEVAGLRWKIVRELVGKQGIIRKYPESIMEEGAKLDGRSNSN